MPLPDGYSVRRETADDGESWTAALTPDHYSVRDRVTEILRDIGYDTRSFQDQADLGPCVIHRVARHFTITVRGDDEVDVDEGRVPVLHNRNDSRSLEPTYCDCQRYAVDGYKCLPCIEEQAELDAAEHRREDRAETYRTWGAR